MKRITFPGTIFHTNAGDVLLVSTYGKSGCLYGVFRCVCGKMFETAASNVRNGRTHSCGCHNAKVSKEIHTRHGGAYKSEYFIWHDMKRRCNQPQKRAYRHYGGRGIKVCPRWMGGFATFYADMGPRPSMEHTLDRVDVNKGYSPSNCRWASRTEQANNKTNTRYVTLNGERMPLTYVARIVGINKHTLWSRVLRNNNIEVGSGD